MNKIICLLSHRRRWRMHGDEPRRYRCTCGNVWSFDPAQPFRKRKVELPPQTDAFAASLTKARPNRSYLVSVRPMEKEAR